VTGKASGLVGRLRAAGCVFAEDEAALLLAEAADDAELERLARRREAGEPLEHVLGWAELSGHRVRVDPGVFVPRRRSEAVVVAAVQALARRPVPAVVVDLCCGTGALGAAVARDVTGVALWCVDLDPAAVVCARANVQPLGGTVLQGDLAGPLPGELRGRVDVLLASPPYVPSGDVRLMPPEARLYERPDALDGGPDGLDVARRVVALAPTWLAPGGTVLVEVARAQAAVLGESMRAAGLQAHVVADDERDATVVTGTR
jgi:release factor glutamine methyltransferase